MKILFLLHLRRWARRMLTVSGPRMRPLRRAILFLLIIVVGLSLLSIYYLHTQSSDLKCIVSVSCVSSTTASVPHDHRSAARLRLDHRALVFTETQYSHSSKDLLLFLEAARIAYKVEVAGKNLPPLTKNDKGKFGVILFETIESYLSLSVWNHRILTTYCTQYHVGIIAFVRSDVVRPHVNTILPLPLNITLNTEYALRNFEYSDTKVLRIARSGERLDHLPEQDWVSLKADEDRWETLTSAWTSNNRKISLALCDHGLTDGIKRIVLGVGIRFWPHKLLLLDALSYLSHGKFSLTLTKHIMIDIDDIFVGRKGTRILASDVKALIETQDRLRRYIHEFRFNLGFSGHFWRKGTSAENLGDDALLANKDQFRWFPHMWRHLQPHHFDNISRLVVEMTKNKYFAEKFQLPILKHYAVAPHHSGVFPVHDPLFTAWKDVWDVRVTSTEEYPHLRPAWNRRGFYHKEIYVLPRQTCDLYTHTLFMSRFPGGSSRLESSIRGGDLFFTFILNPVSIFMTHFGNYGSDRLAQYTFESVVKFLSCWTHLHLVSDTPLQLAKLYFHLNPSELTPLWSNPCDDKRHAAIWSASKSCRRLPEFIVIGPQKTGTTALYTFLSMHPSLVSNINSPNTFEEVQFFSGRNYLKGLDWYMSFFPDHGDNTSTLLFEKSARYFDKEEAPLRVATLLPRVKLITILINPKRRAYSWYQHMRAHGDPTALNHSFFEVIMAAEGSTRLLRELRTRSLMPGLYALHLERWLTYFQPSNLLVIDGQQLRTDPVAVMDKVQIFLNINPYYDYSKRLRYSPQKGFFCQVVNKNQSKCLGRSKGRNYDTMDAQSEFLLQKFYQRQNIALSKLLKRLGYASPSWLIEELNV